MFSRLREWRKGVAEREGVPVYAVLTNEQLAQMVRKKVGTLAALREVEGVGEARIEKYGEALLKVLTAEPQAAVAATRAKEAASR